MLCIPVGSGTAYSVGYVVDLFAQNKENLKVHENTPVDMYLAMVASFVPRLHSLGTCTLC